MNKELPDRWNKRLREELEILLNHFLAEHTMSYEELIGMIEMMKHDWMHENWDNIEKEL